jgi:aminopeptidase N
MGGLSALLLGSDTDAAAQALDHFYQQWQHDALVMDKWFALQASARTSNVDTVRALMLHPAFSLRNPNRARALIFQFCINNLQGIHTPQGYAFWAEQVLALDAINPEIAARLARAFDNWARFTPQAASGMKAALQTVSEHPKLSRNVNEIVSKALTL